MSGDANTNGTTFSTLEIDTIGEIMNISMGSAATAASTLLDNKVTITTPIVNIVDIGDFDIKMLEPAIAVEIQYIEGITGSNILILRQADAKIILAQMMQMELAEDYELDEMAQSAICELMNQMMGSSATVLSCFLGRSINITTPTSVPIGEWEEFKKTHLPPENQLLTIKFTLSIQNVMESEFVSVMAMDLAKEIIDVSLNFDSEAENAPPAPAQAAPPPAAAASPPSPSPPPPQPEAAPGYPQAAPQQQPGAIPPAAGGFPPAHQPPGYPSQYPPQYPPQYAPPGNYPQHGYPPPPHPGYAPHHYPPDPIMVKGYDYSDFGNSEGVREHPHNLDLVLNVPVTVTVELGRTRRKIKEILEFGQGTIVELDKQAGSQVDVIVNGQLVAKGDVVVVDDNFSIRITEILKARDSLTMT